MVQQELEIMLLTVEPSVKVITPSIGSDALYDAINSVQKQTYGNVIHLIVADGEQYLPKIKEITNGTAALVCSVPFNTGADHYYGHRIYAAFSHLLNSDYIMFLDEDNWYKEDHVKSLVNILETNYSLDFAYSLRSIYNDCGEYLIDDNCESLGEWPIWLSNDNFLVDTSSYCFRRKFIEKVGHLWHNQWGADRDFFMNVRGHSKSKSSRNHTLAYRLDGNPNSVNEEFFIKGNEITLNRYGGKYPWNE